MWLALLLVGAFIVVMIFVDGEANEEKNQEKAIQKRIDNEVDKRLKDLEEKNNNL